MNENPSTESVSLPIRAVALAVQLVVAAAAGYGSATLSPSHDSAFSTSRLDHLESTIDEYIKQDSTSVRTNDKSIGVILETISACKKDNAELSSRVTYLERYIYSELRKGN